MSATLGDLVEEVLAYLRAYTADLQVATTLTGSVTNADLTLGFTDTGTVGRGLVELDDELLYVTSVDGTTATVPPWGRGQQGSTAAAHAAGAKLTVAPRFPRARVKSVINEVLRSLNPDIFAVKTSQSLTSSAVTVGYPAPADLQSILDLRFQDVGATAEWLPIRRFRLEQTATTPTLYIFSPITSGRTIRITYRAELSEFPTTAESQVLSTVTGLADNARDVVVLLASARLLAAAESARMADVSTQQSDSAQARNNNGLPSAVRTLLGLAESRRVQEVDRLNKLFPPLVYTTR